MVIKGTLNGYAARPTKESWEVNKETVDTTQGLIDKLGVPAEPVPAIYHFQRKSGLEMNTPDLLKSYVPKGLAYGAIGGAVTAGGLGMVGSVLNVLTLGVFGGGGPTTTGLLVGGAAIGAGLGLMIGISEAITEPRDYAKYGEYISGTITADAKPDGTHLTFHPWNELSNQVDLQDHAHAPLENSLQSEQDTWWAKHGHSAAPIG